MIKDRLLKIVDDISNTKKIKFCGSPEMMCVMCKYRLVCLEIFQSLVTCESVLEGTIEMINHALAIDIEEPHIR